VIELVLEDGPLRKRLRQGRLLKRSFNPGNAEVHKISRKVLTDLIYDEEKASADYRQLATNPVFTEGQRQLILGIADDEERHKAAFTAILRTLEGEGKVV